jgi:hypothetical protein
MDFLIALAALCFLMLVAYRGFSVILFAPIAAIGVVFLTDPHAIPAAFTSLLMEKMVVFAKLYFPVFLLSTVYIIAARDSLKAKGARVLGDGEPKIGAHGKPVLFLHPKDFAGTLIEQV